MNVSAPKWDGHTLRCLEVGDAGGPVVGPCCADEPLRGGEGLPRRGVSAVCSPPRVLALASLAIGEGETVDCLTADLVGDPLVGIWIVSPRPSDTQTGHCVVWGLGGGKSVGSLALYLREVVGRTVPETTSKWPSAGSSGLRCQWAGSPHPAGSVHGAAAPCRRAAPSDL